jgi:predicted MFS family arabinose efflux permease
VLVFAAVIGLTYLSTVPPTAGLVAQVVRPAHMATLFGLVMLSHQVGGFLGAWLGGKAFDGTAATTGCGTPTSCWRWRRADPPADPRGALRLGGGA